MDDSKRLVEDAVLRVYQKVNPSELAIEDAEKFSRQQEYLHDHFLDHLKLPPALFRDARVLDVGAGTGERSLFYALWGGRLSCVDMNGSALARVRTLFEQFGVLERLERVFAGSLFEFTHTGPELFDLTVSDGVLHHTSDPRAGFAKQIKYLRPGGFTILGISTSAGLFQRSLQRGILYILSGGREDEIERLARALFGTHVERAARFGGRSEQVVIYDSFVNPKWTGVSTSAVLTWFEQEQLRLYSTWPPILPVPLGDSPMRPAWRLEHDRFRHIGAFAELHWLLHREDDEEWLAPLLEQSVELDRAVTHMTDLVGDVSPGAGKRLDGKSITEASDALRVVCGRAVGTLSGNRLLDRLDRFVADLSSVFAALKTGDVDSLRTAIDRCEVLFKGSCGLGMNYFVGYKE